MELPTNAESGIGIDPEAHADSAAKYDSEAGWERSGILARIPSCGYRIRSERGIGLGTESRTNAESGMGIDPEAHAEAVANKNSEASLTARWEAGADSATEALSNRIPNSISESSTVRTDAESGSSINSETHTEAVVNKNSEVRLNARSEAGSESQPQRPRWSQIPDSSSDAGSIRNPREIWSRAQA